MSLSRVPTALSRTFSRFVSNHCVTLVSPIVTCLGHPRLAAQLQRLDLRPPRPLRRLQMVQGDAEGHRPDHDQVLQQPRLATQFLISR